MIAFNIQQFYISYPIAVTEDITIQLWSHQGSYSPIAHQPWW